MKLCVLLHIIVLLIVVALLSNGCEKRESNNTLTRLQQWDTLLYIDPHAVLDSLRKLEPLQLSSANRAYYHLIKIISEDKIHAKFTSDSLITEVVNYYNKRIGYNDCLRLKALVYQGIVRYRMNIFDSTVVIPLKEAERLFSSQNESDGEMGFLMNYYLGETFTENRQSGTAEKYYKNAYEFAKLSGDETRRFAACLALFWNKMIQEKFDEGKLYLDSIQMSTKLTQDEKYRLLNAQSLYYDMINLPEQSLRTKIEQKDLIPSLSNKNDVFRLYSSLSDRYMKLNELDSALYYARLSIENVVDTSYMLSYLLFENIANIAEKQQLYRLANDYRKKATLLLKENKSSAVEAHIRELDRKYAFSEMRNKTMKTQQRVYYLLSGIIIILLLSLLQYLYFSRQRSISERNRERHLTAIREASIKRELAESQALSMQKQNDLQQQILQIYSLFIQYSGDLHQRMIAVATSIRGKYPLIADKLDSQLKESQKQVYAFTDEYFTPDKIKELLSLSEVPSCFNSRECLILYMLSFKMDNHQIAALLHTSDSSFKARKNQLKKKVLTKVVNPADLEKIQLLF